MNKIALNANPAFKLEPYKQNLMRTRVVSILILMSISAYAQFTPSPQNLQGVWGGQSVFGDLDNDGDLDLIVSGNNSIFTTTSKLYKNDGNGNFVQAATLAGVDGGSIDLGDYDRDGLVDILMVGSMENLNGTGTLLFRNKGNFVFEKVSHSFPYINWGVAKFGDFDNDGDEDVLLVGANLTDYYHDLYINENGTFTAQGLNLPRYNDPAISIGDYDLDSDLDYVVVGSGNATTPTLYQNQGGYTFTPTSVYPNLLSDGNVAWADFDNDGDPDLAIMGYDEVLSADYLTVLRNTGNGGFTPVAGTFDGLSGGNLAWGDLDNDGDNDLVVTGSKRNGTNQASTAIYINNNGVFTRQTAGLPALTFSQLCLGDADNDLDLDMVVTGSDPGSQLASTSTRLYLNSTSQPNTKPIAPGTLQFAQDGQRAELSWNKSTDGQTSADALTYNLYINRLPGQNHAGQTLSNPSTGFRKVVKLGNVQHNTSWVIDNLEPGTYYWGVQAIDAGFIGSQFSTEQGFNMAGLPPVITSLSSVAEKTGTTIVITGANFNGTSSVKLKGSATSFQVINSTTMKVVIPDVIGSGLFEVTNAAGTTTSTQAFCVIPATPAITGNTLVCPGEEYYAVDEILGVTYEWTIDTGGEIVENNNHQIKIKWIGGGDYQVRVVPKTCESGDESSISVHVNGPLLKTVRGNFAPTTEAIEVYSLNYSASESYLWTLSLNSTPIETSTSDFFLIKWTQPGTYDLHLRTTNGECPANPVEQNFVINVALSAFSYQAQIPVTENKAISFADLDDDGDQDFIFDGNKLYENVMPAGFQERPSLPTARSVQYADIDGDNDLDLLITYYNNGYEIAELENLGGLSFGAPRKIADKGYSPVAAYIDFDNDSDLDIAWMGTAGFVVYERLANGFQRVEAFSGIRPSKLQGSIEVVDFNADGRSDIVTSSGGVFLNTGAKSFISKELSYPVEVSNNISWVDVDQDGDLDLAQTVANTLELYTISGETFTRFYSLTTAMGTTKFADMNGDGWKDLIVGPLVRVFLFDPNTHSFTTPLQTFDAWTSLTNNDSWLSGIADLNNDKKNDLVIYGNAFGNSSLILYTNNHTNTFVPTSIQSPASTVKGNEATLTWQGDVKKSFEVILGTSPTTIDKITTWSDLATGSRKVPQPGNAGNNNFYRVTNLSPGTYYWRVQTIDNAFQGSPFNSASSFTIAAPAMPAPEILRINAVSNGISLLWNDNSTTEQGFIIERSENDITNFIQVGTVAAGVTTFNENVSLDIPHFYRVKAFKNGGESYYSNIISTDDAVITTFPYKESFEGLARQWRQLEGDKEQAINGLPLPGNWSKHEYFFAADGTHALRIENGYTTAGVIAAIESPSFDLSGMINPCLVYDFLGELDLSTAGGDGLRVYATLDAGTSWQLFHGFASEDANWYRQQADLNPFKVAITKLRIVGILSNVMNQALSFDDIRVVECPTNPGDPQITQTGTNELQLSWNHSLNATRYFLERSTDGGSYIYIDTLDAPVNSYLDKNLAEGKTYEYRIFAVNDDGPAYSNYATFSEKHLTKAPLVQTIPNQTINVLETLSVEATITDETPVASLDISVSSSNTAVIRSEDISIEKQLGGIKVTLASTSEVSGVTTITIRVKDEYHTVESGFALRVVGDNAIPIITSQKSPYAIDEDGLFTLSLAQLVIVDDDNALPDMTLLVAAGTNYTLTANNTIRPSLDFNGTLSIPVKVNDGTDDSDVFNFTLSVTPVNDAPVVTGIVGSITVNEDEAFDIPLNMLMVSDVDNPLSDMTVKILPGDHYSVDENELTPEKNFNGPLSVSLTVNDGHDNSAVFVVTINVLPVDDAVVITGANKTFVSENSIPVDIELSDLIVVDDSHAYPTGYDLMIFTGENYGIEGNTITPVKGFSGTLYVPVQVSNGVNLSNVYRLEVTVRLITANEEIAPALEVYPNPNHGKFKFKLPRETDAIVRISHSTGGVVYVGEVSGALELELDLQIPSGVYFLEIVSGGERKIYKFIVL